MDVNIPPRVGYRRDFNIFLNRHVYRRVPRPVPRLEGGLYMMPYWEPVREGWVFYPEYGPALASRLRNGRIFSNIRDLITRGQLRDFPVDQTAEGRGFDQDAYAQWLRQSDRIPGIPRAPPTMGRDPMRRWREIEEARRDAEQARRDAEQARRDAEWDAWLEADD